MPEFNRHPTKQLTPTLLHPQSGWRFLVFATISYLQPAAVLYRYSSCFTSCPASRHFFRHKDESVGRLLLLSVTYAPIHTIYIYMYTRTVDDSECSTLSFRQGTDRTCCTIRLWSFKACEAFYRFLSLLPWWLRDLSLRLYACMQVISPDFIIRRSLHGAALFCPHPCT